MIQDLGELKKLLKLCRSQGVLEIEFDNIKLKLGDLPLKQEAQEEEVIDEGLDQLVGLPTDPFMPEIDPLAFYSASNQQ